MPVQRQLGEKGLGQRAGHRGLPEARFPDEQIGMRQPVGDELRLQVPERRLVSRDAVERTRHQRRG